MSDNENIVWTSKYKPKNIKDLVTNKKAVLSIISWLRTFNRNKKKILSTKTVKSRKSIKKDFKSCMVVSGNHGIGKTTTVKVILKELGYSIHEMDVTNIKAKDNIEKEIKSLVSSVKILSYMNEVNEKQVILIDELESISTSTNKKCITMLHKLNEQYLYCPIIFICNREHNKLISSIKKDSIEIKMWEPYQSEMKQILTKIKNNEDIKISNQKVMGHIINHAQGDIRRLILTLQDIKYAYGSKQISEKVINDYLKMSNRKDVDIDLYKATHELLNNYESIDNCLSFYETEKVLLPLMLHQNYMKNVFHITNDTQERIDLVDRISTLLSTADVIENYIYGDQNWEMQEVHGFFTCVAPSYYLYEKSENQYKDIRDRLTFTTDLNKTSIKKINRKNIMNADKCFKNMNIDDYIYINKVIRKLIANDELEKCVEFLRPYNINLEYIESLLKIDKIRQTRNVLSSKQKTEFKNILEN